MHPTPLAQEKALVVEILAVLIGAGIAFVVSSSDRNEQARLTIRLAAAERLSQIYGDLVASAWVLEQATDMGSWSESRLDEDEALIHWAGERARARLVIEEDIPQIKAINDLYRSINRRYANWRLRQQTYLQHMSDKSYESDAAYQERTDASTFMTAEYTIINQEVTELERLCRAHLSSLRKLL